MIKVFILGSKCNMSCKFCMSVERDLEKEVVVDNLLKMNPGDLAVFAGGEPLLYPNLGDFLKIAKSRGLRTKIHTNGVLLNRVNFLDLIDIVNLPLDGPKFVHDAMRANGHFDIVMDAFKKLSKQFTITTALTKKNIEYIDEIVKIINKLAERRNILNWKIFKFKSKGRGSKYKDEFEISDEDFLSAINVAKAKSNIKIYAITDPDAMKTEVIRKL
ncbi:MAG: hypothetical protein DSY33_00315 [Archaeoglobus sp.]|nr:MAG: hypothetical protein DSY33_00315 [Archaeoglobus sp.]